MDFNFGKTNKLQINSKDNSNEKNIFFFWKIKKKLPIITGLGDGLNVGCVVGSTVGEVVGEVEGAEVGEVVGSSVPKRRIKKHVF